MRLELEDRSISSNREEASFAVIRNCESGQILSRVAVGCYYQSFYKENGTAYVIGTVKDKSADSGSEIRIYESRDLIHWSGRTLFRRPGWSFYNTSLTKGPDGYVLLTEAGAPSDAVGEHPFTMFFSASPDLVRWSFLPDELGYPKDRYSGGPWLYYSRGWYYMILLEALPHARYASYIYRTQDFKDWTVGTYNPMMMPSAEDRAIAPFAHGITEELRRQIAECFVCNDSDLDLCEYKGKTVITYNVGNQLGFAYIAQAEYDGGLDDFLAAWFA